MHSTVRINNTAWQSVCQDFNQEKTTAGEKLSNCGLNGWKYLFLTLDPVEVTLLAFDDTLLENQTELLVTLAQ